MELMNARGVRDFPPEEKIARQIITDKLQKVFELYGFVPLETPILERLDILSAKYAGGAEILKETFKLNDQGGRDLCLRYDLTVPLARFVGMNPNMKMPFKRYQLGPVFRDGPIKFGRYREFWQCDVDIIGTDSMLADAQCIQIAQKFFKEMNVEVIIEVNNRKILDAIMENCGIPEEKWLDVILEVDKLKKVGREEVEKAIAGLGIDKKSTSKLLDILTTTGTNKNKISQLKKILISENGKKAVEEIEELLKYADSKEVVFMISLARGLSYYTSTVFEVFLKEQKLKKENEEIIFASAVCGGGRYDKMIGEFLGGGKQISAVGISFGLEPILEVMKLLGKVELKKTNTIAYIIPIQTKEESMRIAETIRAEGINCDMDIIGRGISKNMDYANTLGIPYVIFAGPDELKNNKVKLKDMKSGKEELMSVEEVCKKIKESVKK